MKDISDFFSNDRYIFIPFNNPKVALVVNNSQIAANSFKIYNPFSMKAKILKKMLYRLFVDANFLLKNISTIKPKGKFVKHLEEKLNIPIKASIYFSTTQDKVILQLQNNESIIGYVKYPLNKTGQKRILNEKKALEILYKNNIINYTYLIYDEFCQNSFYLLLPNLNGTIIAKNECIYELIEKFKKNKKSLLKEHPRVLQLLKKAEKEKCCFDLLSKLISLSVEKYYCVYEHGDFAPWNIMKIDNKLVPFDFEYFEREGLEYLDLIKFYYQIDKLLNKKNGYDLIHSVLYNFNFKEKEIIFKIFLIKEILLKIENKEDFIFEKSLLNLMEKR